MSYCSSCGEPVEGRFCRMCGTPFEAVPAEAIAATNVQHGAVPTASAHRPTHAQPPESAFESLFRQPEGQINPHSLTQLIPLVEADYRMPPPGSGPFDAFSASPEKTTVLPPHAAGAYPSAPGDGGYASGPGRGSENWDEDEPGVRKPVLWGTIGAVVAASAVILGLLYIGSHNNNANAGAGSAASTAPTVTAQATIGSVDLAPGSASASPSPSASPSASASTSAPANGGTTLPLTIGSTGTYVHYVQARLQQLGYYRGPVDGQYDQATAQAVVSFQARAQVTGDPAGTVGRSTLTALIAAGSQPDLHLGQRSGDVKRLQEALNSAEHAGLNVNGRYDQATYLAVTRYQSQVGVRPTGTMNAQTWAALQSGTVVG